MNKLLVTSFLIFFGTSAMALTGDLPQPISPTQPIQTTAPAVSHASLSVACIQAFTDAGYDVSYGSRVSLCQRLVNSISLEAVQAAIDARTGLDDSALGALIKISNSNSLRCIKAFTEGGYDITYGNRAALCSRTSSSSAASAIETVAQSKGSLDDQVLSSLVLIRTSLGSSCINAFVSAGYDISYGARASLCARSSYNSFGIAALTAATNARQGLDDGTAQGLLRINGSYALQCVQAFTENGYDITYGSRANICGRFVSAAAIGALNSLARNRSGIDDNILLQFARLH